MRRHPDPDFRDNLVHPQDDLIFLAYCDDETCFAD
jgi:hypothetical protein